MVNLENKLKLVEQKLNGLHNQEVQIRNALQNNLAGQHQLSGQIALLKELIADKDNKKVEEKGFDEEPAEVIIDVVSDDKTK